MKSHEQSKHYGMNAENYFKSILNKFGIESEFVDSWFDFLVNKKYKVEVKSCQLSVKDGKRSLEYYRPGRFDFTEEKNRKLQFRKNIWVAFILRHESNFLLLGFTRAKNLKKKRYVALTELRKISIINFGNWLLQINKKKKNAN